MTAEEATERLQPILAHAWMVRQFLKHADEVQEEEDFLAVHRAIFDYIRALEPGAQRGDFADCIRRARGKLSKLRRAAEFLAAEYRRISDHTNYEMAARSLTACVREIEEILAACTDVPG